MKQDKDGVWLGLDLGGTKVAGGLVEFPRAKMTARKEIPTRPARPTKEILDDCMNLARELTRRQQVRGIGIGIAEMVDLQGNITSSATFPWEGLDLRAAFAEIAPTYVDADVRAAAFAEGLYGAGAEFRLFAYITVGTGISACFVQDGAPYAGARGNALALGSSTLAKGGERAYTLEQIASGAALVERYNKRSGMTVSSGEEVIQAFEAGDSDARFVVESAADALGAGIGLYVNLVDPEAVVVGGGLGSAGGVYWEHAVGTARSCIYAENARELPIVRAALGKDAGVIGAAALARERLG
jgi:glucokinase